MNIVSAQRAEIQELRLKLANANNKIAELEGRPTSTRSTVKKTPIVEPAPEKKVDPLKSFS